MKRTSLYLVYRLSFCLVSKEVHFNRLASCMESRYILCDSTRKKKKFLQNVCFPKRLTFAHGLSELKIEIRHHIYYFYGNRTVVSRL